MTIETKYNIGDEVWFMEDNKTKTIIISMILISCGDNTLLSDKVKITYTISGRTNQYLESELFPSKELLLQSL
jgi:hypothetical protein